MLKNYFTVAIRNFIRQKGYSATNIAGLAVGFICFIFILLWVTNELSYDQFHTDKEKIFIVMDNQTYNGKTYTFTAVPGVLSRAIREEVPEVEFSATVNWNSDFLCTRNDISFQENGFYAEPDFFRIFDFGIVAGNRNKPFDDKNSIAISEKIATKYFGTADVIGESIKIDNETDLKISLVFSNAPATSTLQLDLVIPYERYFESQQWLKNWSSNGVMCYVKLFDESKQQVVNDKIRDMAFKNNPDAAAKFWLQEFTRRRLYGKYENGQEIGGRIEYIKIFSVVGIFVLLIACINFVNLSTARSASRAKEVGMRKVVGAKKSSIITQFLGESILISFIALLVGVLFVYLLLPSFNLLTSKEITGPFSNPSMLVTLVGIAIATGVIAGIYPAFFLSSFRPALVLKGQLASSIKGGYLRKILVIVQFASSSALIISSIIVYQQIDYIRKKDLGLDRENIVYFNTPSAAFKNLDAYKNKILSQPGVLNTTLSSQLPLSIGSSTSFSNWPGKMPDDKVLIQQVYADPDFLKTFNIQLIEGRNFSGAPADSSAILLSEEAVSRLNLSSPAVGQIVSYGDNTKFEIIGVIRNFHSSTLHASIEPMFIGANPRWGYTFIKYKESEVQAVLKNLETVYKEFNPAFPFRHTILSEWYEKQYTTESVTGKLALCFTVVAIFISCLGLLGLASFTVEKKTKEIGIRKVMGASAGSLVVMLCRSYIGLVIVAAAIGCSVAYFAMKDFLDNYAYHISIGWGAFAITSLAVLIITLATVAYQAIKAATLNPTSTLRSE
jgi:ABC-type antimicrobial peptide transport system permease subunit